MLKLNLELLTLADRKKHIDVEGVVDTGAVYTVVGKTLLESIGLKPVEKRRFRVFGGEVEREIDIAEVELMGRKGGVTLIFGEKDDAAILGATASEALGLEVDPHKKHVERSPATMLLKQC